MDRINQNQSGGSGEKGFAILFAVLVSSVLLSVGLSIFNLTVKELILSSSGRESQFSFYAADTGAECAIYWDFRGTEIFATSSDARSPQPSNPDCADTIGTLQYININASSTTATSATTQFTLNIPIVNPQYCAIVTVEKKIVNSILVTVIDSRGYNTPCNDTSNPNRLERALRVTY